MSKLFTATALIVFVGFWTDNYKGVDGVKCCGKNDCFVRDASNFVDAGDYILLKNTGEKYPKAALKPSEDGKFWQCMKGKTSTTRCVFFPVGV